MKIGVVGGTGFYDLLDETKEVNVDTEFGTITLYHSDFAGKDVYFLPRHGLSHDSLAHEVNYKGNMLALKKCGVERVFAMCAVGSLTVDIPVGKFALLDQFVDITTNRDKTYGLYSVDLTEPYCSDLRENFMEAARELEVDLVPKATYICVDGPRYETSAEIKLYKSWGMDVVGMTNATEASLARELGLCYSVVTLATDLAAGISDVPPDLDTHKKIVDENKEQMSQLMLGAIKKVSSEKQCSCYQSYERAVKAREEKLGKTITYS